MPGVASGPAAVLPEFSDWRLPDWAIQPYWHEQSRVCFPTTAYLRRCGGCSLCRGRLTSASKAFERSKPKTWPLRRGND